MEPAQEPSSMLYVRLTRALMELERAYARQAIYHWIMVLELVLIVILVGLKGAGQ